MILLYLFVFFFPYVSDGVYPLALYVSFSLFTLNLFILFFSLSLLSFFLDGSLYASASETSRVGFTEFLLQKIRGGGVCTTGGGDK